MTLTDFITRYNGKYVDTDGAYGGQCMDLMHQYCVEVLGIQDLSVLAAPSAKSVYENFSNVKGHELFEQIGNTPTGVPQEGDLMFWVNAPYGHVAVFHDGDANSFKSFDQNYPTGSPCHIQNHTYANVGGWLRFKGQPIPNNQELIDQLRSQRDTNWNLAETYKNKAIELETIVEQKNKTVLQLEKTVQDATNEKQEALEALQRLTEDNLELSKDKKNLADSLEKAILDLGICKSQRKDLGKYLSEELKVELKMRKDVSFITKIFL